MALPNVNDLIGATVTESQFKTALAQFLDYVASLNIPDFPEYQLKYELEQFVSGRYKNYADFLIGGYIRKTDGVLTASSGYCATIYIQVEPTTRLRRYGTLIGASSSAAAVAFYDSNKTFLGVYTDTANTFDIEVQSQFPNVKYVRFSYQSTGSTTINVAEPNVFIKDYFADSTLNGYVSISGGFVAGGNWVTTQLIPCQLNQRFRFSGQGNSGVVSSVSGYDADGLFLESIYSATGTTSTAITITNPLIKYIKASAATTNPRTLTGIALPVETRQFSTIIPSEVYALKNESLYLYMDGMVQGLDNVAFNISESNRELCRITPTSSSDINIKLRAIGNLSQPRDIGSFNVKVTDTPVNPATKRYFIPIGDSTTEGVALSGIQGAYVNELSRRLNGVGRQILDAQYSPAPLALSNIQFIGTRGDEVVKHEGRGGWRPSHYLNNDSVSGVTNAFWNPSTSQFDLSYYLNQNGFTGVNSDGSNLTIILFLGWNDVYNSNANTAANDMSALIDRIRATHPLTDIICLGLNPAPKLNIKTYQGGERYISQREVFESIRQFNNAFIKMIATKTNVKFLQISQSFNVIDGYNYITRGISNRSGTTTTGCFDHVHPNQFGYANIADIVFYYILYKYCRGA